MTRTKKPEPALEGITLDEGRNGMRVLTLRGDGSKPFILDETAIETLERLIGDIEADAGSRGLLVRGDGQKTFCAGADVDRISQVTTAAEARELSERGQELFLRIESLPIPVVAAIHGTCVGGGLELALACDDRVASDAPATRLGLPEVKLGILPAWGGTSRLPECVGFRAALTMLLTGRLEGAWRAERLGLVREAVPAELLFDRGMAALESLASARAHGHHGKPGHRRHSVADYLLEEFGLLRRPIIAAARKRVLRETGGHYPAPLEILRVLEAGLGRPLEKRLELERDALGRLIEEGTWRQLVSLFRRTRDSDRGAPYDTPVPAERRLERAAVVGAGVMGSGIAQVLLLAGKEVRLIDPFPEAVQRARGRIEREVGKRVAQHRLSRSEGKRRLASLTVSTEITGLADADVVIEAVPEVMEIKEKTFESIDAGLTQRKQPIVASNTSSLSLSGLAEHVRHPERFAGLHFFNPAPKMPLVEVVRGPRTSDETIARLLQLARDLGKTPVVVKDSPAFAVNRLLAPYMMEALRLLRTGVGVVEVDRAMRRFGLPMGPFELMDTVGLDIALHVSDYLSGFEKLGIRPDPLLQRMVDRGLLGRKVGRGFYVYRGRKKKTWRFDRTLSEEVAARDDRVPRPDPDAIRERLLGTMASEARALLSDGVVMSEDDLDIASIFGMGFPPYTGGIATWMRDQRTNETS